MQVLPYYSEGLTPTLIMVVGGTFAGTLGVPPIDDRKNLGEGTMSTQTVDSTDLNSAPTRRPGESPRQQSVCIEIPVSVHGSRSASRNLNNSQSAKPFLEETRTM